MPGAVPPGPADATSLLAAARQGDARAADLLFPLVYDELRALARGYLRRERPGHTLHPTALVHEVYLRLFEGEAAWNSRGHFLAVAARVMRQVLTDHARARLAGKRAGNRRATLNGLRLDAVPGLGEGGDEQAALVLSVDAALDRLARLDAGLVRIVELRFFGGFEVEEAAEALGVSPRTAARQWARAKAHLHELLRDDG